MGMPWPQWPNPKPPKEYGTMKARKQQTYRVKLTCSALDVQRTGKFRARNGDRAWRLALNRFFARYPQALERRLSVGGSIALAR